MNKQEAYKILECSPSISEDDLKKKYKELAKKYHPDLNPNNPNKFKEINEAFQFIQGEKEKPSLENNISFDMNDIISAFQGFGGFNRQQSQTRRNVSNISINQEITFEESILGADREIEIDREIKCETCNGQGFKPKKNNCTHCDGFGQSTIRQGNVIFNSACSKCRGQGSKEECQQCNKKTFIPTKTKIKVKIPAGLSDKNTIRLQGGGHYAYNTGFGDAHSDILLTVNIKNDTQLKLDENDVIFKLDISLLEAIEGCSKSVPSIKGEQNIEVPSGSRNKDEIILKNLGVNLVGNQRVILDVAYPENKEKIISLLKEEK